MSTTFLDSVFGALEGPGDAHPRRCDRLRTHLRTLPTTGTPTAVEGAQRWERSSSGPILSYTRSPAPSRNCRIGSKRRTLGCPMLPTWKRQKSR